MKIYLLVSRSEDTWDDTFDIEDVADEYTMEVNPEHLTEKLYRSRLSPHNRAAEIVEIDLGAKAADRIMEILGTIKTLEASPVVTGAVDVEAINDA